MKQSDSQSSVVGRFYNLFPFPDEQITDSPPPGFNWRWSYENVYAACTGALPLRKAGQKCLRILDAGCGTGVSTDYLAHQNPGSEILGIDISNVALDLAEKRLARSGGNRQAKVCFEKKSLFDMQVMDLYGFDFINSIGVLHHLHDPLAGLQKLSSLLNSKGIMHLFVYAGRGRSSIQRVQKALRIMKVPSDMEGIKQAKKLLTGLPETNNIRLAYERDWSLEANSDSYFADMFFHPVETSFNLSELFDMIDKTDLDFSGFSNPYIWNLERFLDGSLLDKAKQLERMDQFKLVEELDPEISHFEFFLSRNLSNKYHSITDNEFMSLPGKLNPYLRGWPGLNLYDSDLNLIEITSEQYDLLKALEENPRKKLGSLMPGWDQKRTADVARDLHQKQILLIYPI